MKLKSKQAMSVGIMGVGFVGGSVKRYFESKKTQVFVYDKFKHLGSVAEVNRAGVVFICVPTPFDLKSGFSLSAVESAIRVLSGSKIVVIKSTILPGTVVYLQKRFPKHKIMFNPEFLRATIAYSDFISPERQIIGVTKQSRPFAKKIMGMLPKAPYRVIVPSGEAEVIKYMGNSFLAMKVVFANEFYDLCKKLGLDYEKVREAVRYDSRIGNSHLDVSHNGYRGYGGTCFPKDVNSIIQFAKKHGVKMELLVAGRNINQKFLKLSGLSEADFLVNKPTGSKKRRI